MRSVLVRNGDQDLARGQQITIIIMDHRGVKHNPSVDEVPRVKVARADVGVRKRRWVRESARRERGSGCMRCACPLSPVPTRGLSKR